ncbi:hypothetical protein D9611_011074 [Ephemerocybe angulata]|uniref:Glycoside hydrolase 131 catalytic N-terminal domain-containing protein n=1 Tax=Ephemerocybe angulata TaxID=980116 RepID=A0A8H5BB32_9AGAR|nr:hypothetical protein D9611_011074 [Tulosesus angulatus]
MLLPLPILFSVAACFGEGVLGKIIWDGRAPLSFSALQLDASADPYLTAVKGSKAASLYTHLMGNDVTATPLWLDRIHPDRPFPAVATEQTLRVFIGNTSIFVPGQGTGTPQTGFRRTELIAQRNGSASLLKPDICSGKKAFHFSLLQETMKPLDLLHEYQVVFVEPGDGSHVFGVQLGSPFTNPTGPLPSKDAGHIKVLAHDLRVLYKTPFRDDTWHNFAVVVDWDQSTLQVFYSRNEDELRSVTKVVKNLSVPSGEKEMGDFHFGVLKLPLVNANDPVDIRGDVVHHGIQEGTVEGLMFSGVFVEDLKNGLSVGNKKVIHVW